MHIALRGKAGASLAFSDAFVPYAGYSILWMLDKEYKLHSNDGAEEKAKETIMRIRKHKKGFKNEP